METEKRNQSSKCGQLESTIAKKNCELINKELEINDLKRQIENLETEKSALKDRIKNDKASKQIKEVYEAEKWKNLAEISTLKQQNEALKERAKENQEISNAFKSDLNELEKLRKENALLRKEQDESKKDKQITKLSRKLEKALTEIRKLQNNRRDHLEDLDVTVGETNLASVTFKNLQISGFQTKRRFPIFNLKRRPMLRQRRTKFLKLGSLLYSDFTCVLGKKPIISDSPPSFREDDAPEDLDFTFSLQDSVQAGMKRKGEPAKSSPRKRKKGVDHQSPYSPMKPTTLNVKTNLPSIRCLSPQPVHRESTKPSNPVLSFPSQTDSSDYNYSEPLSSSTPCRQGKEVSVGGQSQPRDQETMEARSSFHPSAPETVIEGGVKNLYFNPNPVKVRTAHRMVEPVPIPRVPVSMSAAEKTTAKAKVTTSAVLLKSTKVDVSLVSAARGKLLQSGLTIEVNTFL